MKITKKKEVITEEIEVEAVYEKQEIIKQFFNILREDEDYQRAWKDNIAMAFKDEYERNKKDINIHRVANDAAEYFFKTLLR